MSAHLAGGLALALASALTLNWGFLAQHGAAADAPPLSLQHPLASLRLLFGARAWLRGFAVGLAGWALYVAALALAPLALVQAVAAGGIAILAMLLHVRGRASRAAEWFAVVVAVGVLGASLGGSHADRASAAAELAWVLGACVAAAGAGLVLRGGAGLGIASGTFYGVADVATKAAVLGRPLFLLFVAAASGLAFASLQLGFQRGDALPTIGLSTLLTNALPIAAGIVLFGEGLGAVRAAGFALVLCGSTLFAVFGRRDRTGERHSRQNRLPAFVRNSA